MRNTSSFRKAYFLTSVAAIACLTGSAQAQQSSGSDQQKVETVVVTGSRIRQTTDTTTPTPVTLINPDTIEAQGFSNAGQALAEMTSMSPPQQPTNAAGISNAVNGQASVGSQYPNLFNLGAGRTLTLVNGRRVVSTTGALGDDAFDANFIPVGLLQRIDIVQGGGSVVYGSGAIAGVINYVLKDNFDGIHLDLQSGISDRGDYPTNTARVTAGSNFAGGKGNVAINLEFSSAAAIERYRRPITDALPFAVPNLVPGAGTNGIPASTYVQNYFVPTVARNGVVVGNPALFGIPSLLQVNGTAVRFNADGSALVPFNPGTTVPSSPIVSTGGDRDPKVDNGGYNPAIPSVQRYIGNVVGHYDITSDIKLSTEVTYGKSIGTLPNQQQYWTNFVNFLGGITGLRPLTFTKNNAYLTPTEIAQLSAASPSFAAGGPLVNGKANWSGLFPAGGDNESNIVTVFNGVLALDGAFNVWDRDFYWNASVSHGESNSSVHALFPIDANLRNAINAVRNSSGQIVCAVNNPVVTVPGCVPINMFGNAPISAAAQNYILTPSGANNGGTNVPSVTRQDDFLLSLGGDVLTVPSGKIQFSTTYERRQESSAFHPLPADQQGITFSLLPVSPASGSFHTNEIAAELQVPVFGKEFTLPLVQEMNIDGQYRYVDHSLAGQASLYGAGLRWTVVDDFKLRASYSRNFRAPNISQLVLPSSLGNGAIDNPCGRDEIGLGPNPATRAANCLAWFTANPTFGTGTSQAYGVTQTTPVGAPANVRLANFIRGTFASAIITNGGNPNLTNEYSLTKTYGFVFQPSFIPGLVFTADRIDLNLSKAIVPFSSSQFSDTCFDSPGRPAQYCNTLTYDSSGQILTGVSTTVNAGLYTLQADTFTLNYNFRPEDLLGTDDIGSVNLGLQATRNENQTTTIAGTAVQSADTPALPGWAGQATAVWSFGPVKVNYTMNYLSTVRLTANSTVANSPDFMPFVGANFRHSISASYAFDNYTVRAGINNFTDQMPSFPENYYGDLIGRYYFIGVAADF